MIAYIVAEGSFDIKVIEKVLPQELLDQVRIISAGGLYGVKSLASSLASSFQIPIAIVIDADSLDPTRIEERRKDIQEIVEFDNGNIPIKVILPVPQMEIIFFEDQSLLPRILGYDPRHDRLLSAKFQPKQVLDELLLESKTASDRQGMINLLTSDDIAALRQTPVILEITQFLESVRSQENNPASKLSSLSL